MMQLCKPPVAACLGVIVRMVSAQGKAQYKLTNLDSNQVHQAPTIDPLLANAWGLARSATSPWWVTDNADTGWSTIYDASGKQEPLRVMIPTAGNGPAEPTGLNGPGSPTGIVYNGSTTDFQTQGWSSPSPLFATLDGNYQRMVATGQTPIRRSLRSITPRRKRRIPVWRSPAKHRETFSMRQTLRITSSICTTAPSHG